MSEQTPKSTDPRPLVGKIDRVWPSERSTARKKHLDGSIFMMGIRKLRQLRTDKRG